MTTIAARAPRPRERIDAEESPLDEQQHLVLEGASWELYERLLRDIGDRHIRVTYDQGRMEIMAPLPEHESPGESIGALVRTLTMELRIPIRSLGSTTFRRKDLKRGLEPDKCFYVRNEAKLRGKKRLNLQKDPPPDLVLEVDITRRSIPKLPIYAALRVPEVWRYDDAKLTCLVLRRGKYAEVDRSRAFPFLRVADLVLFLQRFESEDETTVMLDFRDWVRERFRP